MATYEMYRNTTVGRALEVTLKDFESENLIPEALSKKVMATFDKVINKQINLRTKNKISFKAEKLRAYRFCDNVWTFVIEKVEFRDNVDNPNGRVKIVACDGSNKGVAPATAASSAKDN